MDADTGKPETPPNVLLSGIVGSVAYGLDTEGSDVDRMGVFAAPTEKLVGLHPVQQSIVSTKPDATFHEAGKYAALALKVNPTITELMWLPPDLLEVCTPLGRALIGIRSAFLSRPYVKNAYLGYATQQFRRLENRGDGSFSADTRKRTAKMSDSTSTLAKHEDMHPMQDHEGPERVRRQSQVRGRHGESVPGMSPGIAAGSIRSEAGALPHGEEQALRPAGEGGTLAGRDVGASAQTSSEGLVRHYPGGGTAPTGGTAGAVPDLRVSGRSGGSRPRDGASSRLVVPEMQPGSWPLRGQPGNAGQGAGVPDWQSDEISEAERRRRRVAKHARHLYRLHAQGIMLWQTGRLTVRLPHGDAVLCRAFGEDVAAGDLDAGRRVIAWAEHIFDTSRTPLPEKPDEDTVEDWLQEVRRTHYGTEACRGLAL